MKKFGFGWKPNWTQKDLWYATSAKRILRNDAYIGTLRCGITKVSKMKGKKVKVAQEEQYVHHDYMPAIIDKDDFYMAQQIFEKRFNEKVRAGNERIHKYAGILKCGRCGKGFVARNSKRRAEERIVTYVRSTFHKFGAHYCGSHRVMEEDLDQIILEQLNTLLHTAEIRLDEIDKTIGDRLDKKRD